MMNPLQYKLYFWMFIREISYRFNGNIVLIGDGSEFQGYFVIFLYIFFNNNVVEIINKMSNFAHTYMWP